jgi:hypothetical protein
LSSEGEEDKKDPEVDKNGVAKKSAVAKKNAVKEKGRKTIDSVPTMVARKKADAGEGLAQEKSSPVPQRQTRIAAQDSSSPDKTRSAEKLRQQPRKTRSQVDNLRRTGLSPLGKGSTAKRESDRGVRARQRLQAKEAAAAESSEDEEVSSSEQEDVKTVVGSCRKSGMPEDEEEEEEEADADEEASSRESSRRPNTRRLEESKLTARDSPIVRLKQREGRSTSYDSSGSKESLNQVAVRPSRKTKEAAKNYLNLLGQKLTSKKKDENPLEASICPKDLASISPEHRTCIVGVSPKNSVASISSGQPIEMGNQNQATLSGSEQNLADKWPKSRTSVTNSQISDTAASPDDICRAATAKSGSSSVVAAEDGELEQDTSEARDSSESKSPKGERHAKDGKRDKKDKKKSKTSLKDLQNILLAEAKRKIADNTAGSSPEGSIVMPIAVPVTSTGDAEIMARGESEDRIVISQKTGYINVKPRQSLDSPVQQLQEDVANSCEELATWRNSLTTATVAAGLNGPSGQRVSKSGNERTSTPPRKILPKTTSDLTADPQRSTTSPVSVANASVGSTGGRTNHLPVGVMGAAGLSNRFNMTSVATLSKAATVTVAQSVTSTAATPTATFSQPLVIQTSMEQQQTAVAGAVRATSVTTLNIPQSSSRGSTNNGIQQPAAIIVPAASDGTDLRMPLQMATVPIQMAGMQTVQSMSATGTVPVCVRPYTDATVIPQVVSHSQQQQQPLSYQSITSIPVLGPGGMQYSIPVQPCLSRPQQAAVVTVPTYVRSTAYASYVGQQQQQQPTTVMAVSSLPIVSAAGCVQQQQQQQHIFTGGEPHQLQHVVVAAPTSHNLPQTITMPSGTTIQYNVNPSSIRQLQNNPSAVVSDSQNKSLPPPAVQPAASGGVGVLSASTSPLVSPGPPTLSPQITAGAHSRISKAGGMTFSPSSSVVSGAKQVTRPDGGGGSGPPVLTPPVRKSDTTLSDSLVPKSQLVTAQAGVNPIDQCATSVVSSSPAQMTHSAGGGYSYPQQQLRIDPYQSYQAGYHQAAQHSGSSNSSYHSPGAVAGQSPAYAQVLQSPHSYPLSPVQYGYHPPPPPSLPPSHQSPLPSPTSVPPPMQHSPLTPSAQYRNSVQQRQQQQQQQLEQQLRQPQQHQQLQLPQQPQYNQQHYQQSFQQNQQLKLQQSQAVSAGILKYYLYSRISPEIGFEL